MDSRDSLAALEHLAWDGAWLVKLLMMMLCRPTVLEQDHELTRASEGGKTPQSGTLVIIALQQYLGSLLSYLMGSRSTVLCFPAMVMRPLSFAYAGLLCMRRRVSLTSCFQFCDISARENRRPASFVVGHTCAFNLLISFPPFFSSPPAQPLA